MPSSYLFLQMGTRASRGLPADLSTRTQSRSVALDAVVRCLPRSLLTSRWHCANDPRFGTGYSTVLQRARFFSVKSVAASGNFAIKSRFVRVLVEKLLKVFRMEAPTLKFTSVSLIEPETFFNLKFQFNEGRT